MLTWKKDKPKKTITALCKGERSPISCVSNYENYFVAEYMAHWEQPKWVIGKAQHECEVESYINMVDIIKDSK